MTINANNILKACILLLLLLATLVYAGHEGDTEENKKKYEGIFTAGHEDSFDYKNGNYSSIDYSSPKLKYDLLDYNKVEYSKLDYKRVDYSKADTKKIKYEKYFADLGCIDCTILSFNPFDIKQMYSCFTVLLLDST